MWLATLLGMPHLQLELMSPLGAYSSWRFKCMGGPVAPKRSHQEDTGKQTAEKNQLDLLWLPYPSRCKFNSFL